MTDKPVPPTRSRPKPGGNKRPATSPRKSSGKGPVRTPDVAPDLDTESRILAGARRVFIRRGTAGTRMQEIAAEAGVNQALIHYYFGSKDDLAERVFTDAAGSLLRAMAPVIDPSASLEQTLEQMIGLYIDTMRRTPFIPAYLLAEAHQHPERLNGMMKKAVGMVPAAIASTALAHVTKIIAERVAAGTMRPIAPHQFLVNVMALVAFPFAARPMLMGALGFTEQSFDDFLDERRRELPGFILNALRP